MSSLERAETCRNPFSNILVRFAGERGAELTAACGIPGARFVLGGSLGYDAALVGSYDIDLRLLVPDVGKSVDAVRLEIDSVKNLLAEQAAGDSSFSTKFIDEGGTNYIWHTKQIVKVTGIPGNPDVALTWNIQAESSYRGVAEIAARLPQEVKDRYVVAKGMAREESDDAYRTLKKQWMAFADWLIAHGAKDLDEAGFAQLLVRAADSFPRFLKGENRGTNRSMERTSTGEESGA